MKQLKRTACLLICAVALLGLSTCEGTSDGGGPTITVTITGAGDREGKPFVVGVFPQGADIGGFPPAGILLNISGGSASGAAYDTTTGETFEATDGAQYDLSIYIDVNANLEPDIGDWSHKEMLKTITVDGDTVINTVYPGEYEMIPGPD